MRLPGGAAAFRSRLQRARQGLLTSRPRLPARHAEWSIISSVDDLAPAVPDELLDLSLKAITRARSIDLSAVVGRASTAFDRMLLETWPGEHYRLLAAFVAELRPEVVVEIGTSTGMSVLSLREGSSETKQFVTYDIVPWNDFPTTLLCEEDFQAGIEQRLVDLQEGVMFDQELPTLTKAGLIFLDGPKDGRFELRLLTQLARHLSGQGAVLLIDDIRVLAMVRLWRELPFARLDLTSFGHWSGTGVCLL